MSPLKLNTVSYVFYVQIVTSGLVGSVLLALGLLDYHPDVSFISDAVKFEAWLWTMYSILAMPFGMLMLNRVFGVNGKKLFNEYLNAPLDIIGSENRNKLVLILLTIFSISILLYVLANTERVPLYTLLIEGNSEQANIDRITARREFGGIIHIKNLLGLIVVPVISYYSYALFRIKKNFFYLVFLLINLSIGVLMVSHDIQKAPIAFFIIGFAVMEVFISKGISVRTFLIFFGVPVALILIGYSLTTDAGFLDQLTRYNSGFYGRTFLIGYFGFPLSLELFPDVITQSTHFVGLPSFMLPEDGGNLAESARLLKIYTHPETIRAGNGNLYSGFYMGEAWANYGYLGLVIAPFVVGFVIQSVHLFLLLHKKNPWLLAFYCGLTVKWVVSGGFVNFLYLKLLIWPLILYLVSNYILKKILIPKS
jgi:oligosaccharide repeat unit polymerase